MLGYEMMNEFRRGLLEERIPQPKIKENISEAMWRLLGVKKIRTFQIHNLCPYFGLDFGGFMTVETSWDFGLVIVLISAFI